LTALHFKGLNVANISYLDILIVTMCANKYISKAKSKDRPHTHAVV